MKKRVVALLMAAVMVAGLTACGGSGNESAPAQEPAAEAPAADDGAEAEAPAEDALIFLSSWGCDTFAYCTGMLLGRHKLAPVLSPKKSVEGAIGGIAGAALLGVLYGVLTKGNIPIYALICAVGAAASQVGDLAASAVKRQHNIKDYGHLIPGHGGILDRFDSVIVTAPMIYILAVLLMDIR